MVKMMKRLLMFVCFLFVGISSFGQLELNSNNCNGSYIFQYDLDNRDSVGWALESGVVEFNQGEGFLSISSATDSAVFKQQNYYSFMQDTVIEYYTVNLPDTCLSQESFEIAIDQGQNDSSVQCGEKSASIFAKVNGDIISKHNPNNYSFIWSSADEGITIDQPTNSSTSFIITTSGIKTILLEVYSSLGHFIGANEVIFSSNGCNNLPLKEFNVDNCQGEYTYWYSLGNRDSVKWELHSGSAEITQGNESLSIGRASDGTVFKQLNYYFSMANPIVEYYSVNLPEDCGDNCVNESIVDSSVIIPAVWEPVCGCNGVTYSHPYKAYFYAGITNYIQGECETDKYTLEGHVLDTNDKWNHGIIYLFDVTKDEAVDSVHFHDGIYLFKNVSVGTYTVYAVPYTDSNLTEASDEYLPTYYVNKLYRQEANTIEITENTYSVDVRLVPDRPFTLSTQDKFLNVNVSAYPNPFFDELVIKTELSNAQISVLNTQGSVVYNGLIEESSSINTENWGEGVYFVELKTNSGVKVFRVVK